MPIPVQCPKCTAKLTAPDAAAGKRVKCPKCASPITVPAPAAPPAPSFEVVDEPAPAPPAEKPQKAKASVRAEAEADADERPKRDRRADEDRGEDEDRPRKNRRDEDRPRKKPAAEEDDEPRPKRRKDEDDDADDRPRKKRDVEDAEADDDRPRKKRRNDEGSGSKKKWYFIGGGVALLLVGVAVAIILSQSGSPGGTADNKDNKDNKNGTPAPVADDMKVVSPRASFAAKFPGKEKYHREIRELALSADGGTLVATNNTYDENRQTQVWSVKGDPKKLDGYDDEYVNLSVDGTLMSRTKRTKTGSTGKPIIVDVTTGAPADRPFATVSKAHIDTGTERYNWTDSFDERKQAPLKVFHYEQPSNKPIGTYDAGDENRAQFVPPVMNNTELVFALPRTNKVRVFDFAAKKVTREFELANPRNSKGSLPGGGWTSFGCYRVSPDGKWIAVKRWTSGAGPDPFDIFDTTGAVVATLPRSAISDLVCTFLINRDVFVGPFNGAKEMKLSTKDLPAYDINKKQFTAVFRSTHKAYINQIALSADGKVMATCDNDGEFCVWDLTQLP